VSDTLKTLNEIDQEVERWQHRDVSRDRGPEEFIHTFYRLKKSYFFPSLGLQFVNKRSFSEYGIVKS